MNIVVYAKNTWVKECTPRQG